MSNDNNSLFDRVEDHIDGQIVNNNAAEPINDQEFKEELVFRTKIQSEWNRAKRFEAVRDQVKTIHMQKKAPNQTLRYFTYAAAACLLILLAVPGYRYFAQQNSKTFEVNESEIKSAVTFFDTRYKQISPVNGQLFGDESILFEWDTALDVKTNIIITDTETGKVVFIQPIYSEAKQFKFNQYLGKGKYSWRLEGFSGEMIFVMK